MKLKEAIAELRKEEKRKFDQTIDLIVNLKGVDLKRDSVSAVINLPHKIKDKKVCGFLTKRSEIIDSVTQPEFAKFKDKKEMKKLVKNYDFFVAAAPLMPSVATNFGKVLGPAGKMPSPQLGMITQENDESIKRVIDAISKSIKIRAKEPSIKLSAAKESMKDEEIVENIEAIYKGILNALPTNRENVKNVMVKTTMGKPLKVEVI